MSSTAVVISQSRSASQSTSSKGAGIGWPANRSVNQESSTSAMCLSRAASVSVDVGMRCASCAWLSPDAFITSVARW